MNPVRRTSWLVRLLAAFALFFAAITFLPVLTPWIAALRAPWSGSTGDTLIVLGGDAGSDHVLGLSSYWRAVYAVYEWRSGGYRHIVISGGGGVAEAMRDFVVAQGVPAGSIALESKAETTRENALFVASMLRGTPGSKVLLTSDYHSARALRAFRKAGLDVAARPFPDAAKRANSLSLRWNVFLDLVTETTKSAWYKFKGWT